MSAVHEGRLPTDAELRPVVRRALLLSGLGAVSGLVVGAVLVTTGLTSAHEAAQLGASTTVAGVVLGTWPLGRRARPMGRRELRAAGTSARVRRFRRAVLRRTTADLDQEDLRICVAWARVARARSRLGAPLLISVFGTVALFNVVLLVGPDRGGFLRIVSLSVVVAFAVAMTGQVREYRAIRRFLAGSDHSGARR